MDFAQLFEDPRARRQFLQSPEQRNTTLWLEGDAPHAIDFGNLGARFRVPRNNDVADPLTTLRYARDDRADLTAATKASTSDSVVAQWVIQRTSGSASSKQ